MESKVSAASEWRVVYEILFMSVMFCVLLVDIDIGTFTEPIWIVICILSLLWLSIAGGTSRSGQSNGELCPYCGGSVALCKTVPRGLSSGSLGLWCRSCGKRVELGERPEPKSK